jgi:predicted DNA-binding transcriptional regulator AlpA
MQTNQDTAVNRQEPEGYINKRQLAKQMGRTVRSIDTYMANGMIPFYKLGKTVAFKWSEVDEHIQAHFRVCLRAK